MTFIDTVLGLILIIFLISGYRSGFVRKVIGIACLVLGLVIATKLSADISQQIFEPMGTSAKVGFALSFVAIVILIPLAQSMVYKFLIKEPIKGSWNNILGVIVGFFEGIIIISISLIVMSIYLDVPTEETKGSSVLYKPLKNAAPMIFDEVNSFLPESEDFYQQLLNYATGEMKKMEKK